MSGSDKTQKATPQRRKKAREEGQIARSRELGGVLALLGMAVTLSATAPRIAEHWVGFYRGLLSAASEGNLDANGPVLFWTTVEVFRWIVPVLSVVLLLPMLAALAQGGLNVAPAALAPKFERLNPASRVTQILGVATLGNLVKSLLPFFAIAIFGTGIIETHWSELARVSSADIHGLTTLMGSMLRSLLWKATIVLLLWAAADYLLTWRQNESRLRMSHEEIKREHKEHEGNPFIKGQIRKRQRSIRRRTPLEAAAAATLIVTNPTHFAVGLRYESSLPAPEVVAKGRDLLAMKIKAIATENNVPLVENKLLARTLYKTVDVGQHIPAELYQAVAEILVAVFRAQGEIEEQESLRRGRNAAGEVVSPL